MESHGIARYSVRIFYTAIDNLFMHRKHSTYLQQLPFLPTIQREYAQNNKPKPELPKKLNRIKCFRFHEFLEQGYTPFPIRQILTINQKKRKII